MSAKHLQALRSRGLAISWGRLEMGRVAGMTSELEMVQADSKVRRTKRPGGILVLGKVKDILDAFLDVERAGPSEIATRIGGNKSTTFRLMDAMERMGLLDRDPNGSYSLGLWLLELGAIVQSRFDLGRVANPELRLLQQDIGLTVNLLIRHGYQATCIDRVAGRNVDVLTLNLGGSLPLYVGAGPRILLASLTDEEVDRYLEDAPFMPLTRHSIISADQLRADVQLIREREYATSMEDISIGVAALGVPVFDASGRVVAAIAAAGLRHEFEDDRHSVLLEKLWAVAAHVSAKLGAPARSRLSSVADRPRQPQGGVRKTAAPATDSSSSRARGNQRLASASTGHPSELVQE